MILSQLPSIEAEWTPSNVRECGAKLLSAPAGKGYLDVEAAIIGPGVHACRIDLLDSLPQHSNR